jgi:hypothetical protein
MDSRKPLPIPARYTAYLMTVSSPSGRDHLVVHKGDALSPSSRWKTPPSRRELLMLCVATCVIFVTLIASFRPYTAAVDNFGDSSAYMTLASAIRHWNFNSIVVKQFWGLPYAMAALSTVTGVSDRTALLAISIIASFIAVWLAGSLWDGWVAGFFAVLNFDWLQRCYLGDSEPLFVALLFASRAKNVGCSPHSWRRWQPLSVLWEFLRCWASASFSSCDVTGGPSSRRSSLVSSWVDSMCCP